MTLFSILYTPYSTFRAVWIRGAGVKPLRGGVAPTPPVPNSCENRCKFGGLGQYLWQRNASVGTNRDIVACCGRSLWQIDRRLRRWRQ